MLNSVAEINGAGLFGDFRQPCFGGDLAVERAQWIKRFPIPRAAEGVAEEMMDYRLFAGGGVLLMRIPCGGRNASCPQYVIACSEHLEMG